MKVKNLPTNSATISIISLVDGLITEAHKLRASDIHIDPQEAGLAVRMRIDGVLHEIGILPKDIQQEVITRIKVLSSLRTDEHQHTQDGRFRLMLAKTGAVDVRVSIAPTYYGENAVLRLLADNTANKGGSTLETLGFTQEDRAKIEEATRKPHGMILVTGPTGSGKTTTLYTILKQLNSKEISIITIEDPIEYAIAGINQMQANQHSGLSFANGLRSVIRQDPDIIMVGEIRDTETARIAVNTALTGHLMLSTLHTNDAATTLPRLLDLGIEPYLVAATVNLVIGQRLIRTICEHCKTSYLLTKADKEYFESTAYAPIFDGMKKLWRGKGCEECNQTGYKGRTGIYEVMQIDAAIRDAMLKKFSAIDIQRIAHANGMTTMIEDGLKKAVAGITTIEEVLRVTNE